MIETTPASNSAEVVMNRFFFDASSRSTGLIQTLTAILLFAMASVAVAQQNYKTPEAAVDALVATARNGDQKAAVVVLGRDGEDIIASGDKVADDTVRQRFVAS